MPRAEMFSTLSPLGSSCRAVTLVAFIGKRRCVPTTFLAVLSPNIYDLCNAEQQYLYAKIVLNKGTVIFLIHAYCFCRLCNFLGLHIVTLLRTVQNLCLSGHQDVELNRHRRWWWWWWFPLCMAHTHSGGLAKKRLILGRSDHIWFLWLMNYRVVRKNA